MPDMDNFDFLNSTNSFSGNRSFEDIYAMFGTGTFDRYQTSHVVLIVIYLPVFLMGVVGNLVVLLVIFMDPRMRRSSANCFLVNLAISDFLVAVICIPITSMAYIYNVWEGGTTLCKITGYMQGICIVDSILTILLMSVDRYFAIRHPMNHKQVFTLTRVRRLIGVTWLSSAVVVVPIAIVNEVVRPGGAYFSYCTEMWPTHLLRQIYDLAFTVFIYLVPGCATAALYTLMGCRLWSKDASLQRQNSINNRDEVMVARRRLALMMIIISVLFAACWLPYYSLNFCLDFELGDSDRILHLYPFAILLGHTNCAQNPILYCFMHKAFRSFVLKACKCKNTTSRLRRGDNMTSISYGQESKNGNSWNKMSERNSSSRLVNSSLKEQTPEDQPVLRSCLSARSRSSLVHNKSSSNHDTRFINVNNQI